MVPSAPTSDLEGESSCPAEEHQEKPRTVPIDSEETPEKPGTPGNAEDEKSRSVESLYQLHGADETKDDSDSEHSIENPRQTLTRTISEVHDGIESRRDVEIGDPAEEQAGAGRQRDPNLVTWDGPDDPNNPKTWPFKKKWAAVLVVSFFTLLSPVGSTMIAPALTTIGEELSIPGGLQQSLTLSIFILAYAIGPLFLGPMSELYGRVPVLQVSNLVFLFFNLGCGLAKTRGQMIGFRFMAGLGGSAPLAIGGGVLGDLFTAEQRGRAMSLYSLMPLLGPAVGPIAGGFITQRTTWRWVFYSTTIADAVVQVVGLFLLQETYTPVLLARKKKRLIRDTGNADLHTEFDRPDKTVAQTLKTALTRPFRLLGTQFIVQVLALYLMFLYGQLYLQLSTFPRLWETKYGESVEIGGLNYISLGVGMWLGAQVCAPLQDRIYAWMKRREGVTIGRPEFRTPMMVPGSIMVPVSLLIYGWTAQYKTHWIVPNIGVAIFSCGTIICFQCIQGYLVDTYTLYAASAVGAGTVLRSLAGFGFPLFAPYMFDRLDYGWGNTTLAFIAIAIGWPAPILLWKYGEKLRKRSPFSPAG